jgi:hypothetical protein
MVDKFTNAKACFAANLELLPNPNGIIPMSADRQIFWNLSRGLHDLACALEDMDSRLRRLEVAQRPGK